MLKLSIIGSLLLVACGGSVGRSALDEAATGVEVKHYGEIRAVFAGDWTTKAALGTNLAGRGSYGLGALSDLRGEYAVIDGEQWLAYPTAAPLPRVIHASGSDETATLLVAANVLRWQEVELGSEVSADAFEEALRALAETHGVDVAKPFPFLIRGTLRSVAWHVVDGSRVPPGGRPDSTAQQGVVAEGSGTVVGFYSSQHQGVFTMMGRNTHMHVVMRDGSVVGHVQSLSLAKGGVVSVPE